MKRYTPLTRTPMRRSLRPRRETRPGPGRDEAYLVWVRSLPCCLRRNGDCLGIVHAHHAGPKRMDRTAIPLCKRHHGDWHDAAGNGYFGGWRKDARRDWAAAAIGLTQLLHDGLPGEAA